jgi:hypothetical protein
MTATTLGTPSPRERRDDRTTWIRDIHTGDAIASHYSHDELQRSLGYWISDAKLEQIEDGHCEGVELVYVQRNHGEQYELVAWLDEPPHSFTTDEIYAAAVFPVQQAAE